MSEHPLSDTRHTCSSEDADDQLATFMNHDSAYFVFRRFNALNLRHLLQLQAHLLSLEREFERLNGQEHDPHASSRRDELMLEVDDYLHRYSLYPLFALRDKHLTKPLNTTAILPDTDIKRQGTDRAITPQNLRGTRVDRGCRSLFVGRRPQLSQCHPISQRQK